MGAVAQKKASYKIERDGMFWNFYQTTEKPNDYDIFKDFSTAKRALLKEFSDRIDELSDSRKNVRQSRKADIDGGMYE